MEVKTPSKIVDPLLQSVSVSRDRISSVILLFSTLCLIVFAVLLIGLWASINPIEQEVAVPESRWLFRLALLAPLISYGGIYIASFRVERRFLYVGLLSFPIAFFIFILTAQFMGRFLRPLDHPRFLSLFCITLAIGTALSLVGTMIAKLLAVGVNRMVR